jgi:hypothetical protein
MLAYRGVPVDALQLSDIESNNEDSSEAHIPLQTNTTGMPESDNTDSELDTQVTWLRFP